MNSDSISGVLGILAVNITETSLTGWISLACTLLITITTCFIQCYRLIRDRDNDKINKNEKVEEIKEKEENDK